MAAFSPLQVMADVVQMTLHELVLQAADLYADRRAVCFDDCSNKPPLSYTYKEVVGFAKELMHFLRKHCDSPGRCEIGLYCYPGINLASWILGILQVPAAYCPVDPEAPPHLSSYLMRKYNLKYVLVEHDRLETFRYSHSDCSQHVSSEIHHLGLTLFKMHLNSTATSVLLDESQSTHQNTSISRDQKEDKVNILEHAEGSYMDIRKTPLAYVLHTSGTTGIPKIVRVPHTCIVLNILHLRSVFRVTQDDLLFLASPLTFDPSIIELFIALTSGACLLIVPHIIRMMPEKLGNALFHHHRITVLQATPTFLRRFGTSSIRSMILSTNCSLRVLALGGEAFPAMNVFRSWREAGNQTQIFNLYGITEVSSWATCYQIPEEAFDDRFEDYPVPLGSPLFRTQVEIRDASGLALQEGEGQLFVGGEERICFLDDEVIVPLGTLRGTGDFAAVKGTNMFFMGRNDSQIKRHGKRVNIGVVQQAAESLSQVETCAVTWYQQETLVLFVVPRGNVEEREIFKELRKCLPSPAIPDELLLIEALPFTSHGKIDTSKLNKIYGLHLQKKRHSCLVAGEEELWGRLQFIWKSLLGLPEDSSSVPEDSMFLSSGGDSLTSLRLQEEVENLVGRAVPGLLEVILSKTIADIYSHVSKAVFQHGDLKGIHHNKKRKLSLTDNEENSGQYVTLQGLESHYIVENGLKSFVALSRGNRVFMNTPKLIDSSYEIESPRRTFRHHLPCFCPVSYITEKGVRSVTTHGVKSSSPATETGMCNNAPTKQNLLSVPQLTLGIRWKSDTGKCVDASPLAVVSAEDKFSATIYIGSHSHRMQALDLHSGIVKWERILGNRIESSACVSKCGNFIIVGCYDGLVYILKSSTGETFWTFTTEDAVRSSATLDTSTGLVFIGSHDQHTYALNINAKTCVWKLHCGGGSVFSSPCVNIQPHLLYIATLAGLLLAVNPNTGCSIWTYSCGKPLFSSPQCNQEYVCVGCVDKNLYCFNHSGQKIWHFSTNGPVFSSPCLTEQAVLFGSHDTIIYCCGMDGNLMWKFETNAKVYATPCVFCFHGIRNSSYVAAASTDGKLWILDAQNGLLRSVYELPGEVFSSPVVWGTKLVVGCRNDYIYCLDLHATETQ
ncbi:beta-alanine-activating enzyme isoform X2 [Microcaecilia unicolor]|uniref:Beta-alanine-activating enzyme n=1 Tax=Microcaecilia unicolor TaxID=1415580 RepID=A0A6P7WVQ6_9AMPH|nr:beta-alanine-activating enzyme isoform X2 [Microcaecilia unicolor]